MVKPVFQMPLFISTQLPVFHIKNATTIPIPRTDEPPNAANTISTSWYLLLALPIYSKF